MKSLSFLLDFYLRLLFYFFYFYFYFFIVVPTEPTTIRNEVDVLNTDKQIEGRQHSI